GKDNADLMMGLVVVNTSSKTLDNLTISSNIRGQEATAPVPAIPPYSTRKVGVPVNASRVDETGEVGCAITLKQKNQIVDEQKIALRSVNPVIPYRVTFVSEIDGSVQYYAVNPANTGEKAGDALFFSVHGAG